MRCRANHDKPVLRNCALGRDNDGHLARPQADSEPVDLVWNRNMVSSVEGDLLGL